MIEINKIVNEDFTEFEYRKIIKKTKNKYEFIFYDEVDSKDKFVIWRHDVDISVHRAYALAKIEKEEDVKSTYFIQLSSPYYNVFENEIKDLIHKIISLGHQIGIHFDPAIYKYSSIKELEKFIVFEKNILEKLFNTQIIAVSFHNPTKEILDLGNFKIGGVINTYSFFFQNEVEYCSDSCGYWRYKRLDKFIECNYKKIQVLTHPEWWQEKILSPRQKVHRCIDGRANKNKLNYDKELKQLGRLNVK